MAQGITVDISARVVGYQDSIKQLQAALAKIDPGSDIGKSLAKAFEQAQSQVKALSKNMFPKATSDSQIDAIINKTNQAGEAIQRVAQLMQSVNIGDLNLGALGGEIETFRNQITTLQNELSSKLTTGLRAAIEDSTELKSIFSSLGTDLTTASATTILEDISKGAKQAADDVAAAEKEVNKIKTEISNRQSVVDAFSGMKLGTLEGHQELDKQLSQISDKYNTFIESLRKQMTEGMSKLSNLPSRGPGSMKNLLDGFFKDLNPENAKAKINDLFNSLTQSGAFTEGKREFYKQIFDMDVGKGNLTTVINNLNLKEVFNQYKEEINTFFKQIANDIDGKDQAKINRLISEDKLTEAASATTKAIDSAYTQIYNTIKENKDKIQALLGEQNSAETRLDLAKGTEKTYVQAETELKSQIDRITQENINLKNRIDKLETDLRAAVQNKLGEVRSTGGKASINTNNEMLQSASAAKLYQAELAKVQQREQMVGKIQGVVQRWFSIYAAIRMVGNAVRSVISTIKELDATITEIAIVTKMSQSDLWGQMSSYTDMARQYAASISGVYKVSQLYYQQGLQTADVMALTEQTLKMARISGLDYAEATDYMTNAVRSFKMEMTEASTVVDVYSAVAASSATSVTELATAMSKTASSAQAVGASFQNTTAMMAVMIEATRESPENIGSAMKSIISRYGELKENKTGIDSEGEEYSLNKVDKALQSVGISAHDAAGEFRNFDEVIMELAEKWDTIDTNTQRYIATVMAGNRQQSRFLALVSSYDRLKELSAEAADSEDAAQLQFLKTLDSVEAKTQQLQTSLQSLYVGSGLETMYKGVLDIANNIIKSFTNMPTILGLPIPAITKLGTSFFTLATLVSNAFALIKNRISITMKSAQGEITSGTQILTQEELAQVQAGHMKIEEAYAQHYQRLLQEQKIYNQQEISNEAKKLAEEEIQAQKKLKRQSFKSKAGMVMSGIGLLGNTIAASMDVNTQREAKSWITGLSSAVQGIGTGLMIGGAQGGIFGLISALPGIIEAIGMSTESVSDKVERLTNNVANAHNETLKSKDELTTLENYKKKYDELYAARNESNEAYEEYIKLNKEIAANYPELISGMDEEGNYVVSLTSNYEALLAAKQAVYNSNFIKEGAAQIEAYSSRDYLNSLFGLKDLGSTGTGFFTQLFDNTTLLGQFSNAINNVDDWEQSLSTILINAWETATSKLTFNGTESIKELIGKNVWTDSATRIIGSPEAMQSYLQSRTDEETIKFKESYSLDELENFMNILLEDVGSMIETGKSIYDINEYFQQWFDGFELNSDLFGGLTSSSLVAEAVKDYRENLIKSLNIQATQNSIKQQDLGLDEIQTKWMTDWIQQTWEESTQYENALKTGDFKTAWENFIVTIDQQVQDALDTSEYQTLYQNFNSKQKAKIKEIYNNPERYSFGMIAQINEDMNDFLDGTEIWDMLNERIEEISKRKIEQYEEAMQELAIDAEDQELDISFLNDYETWETQFGSMFLSNISKNFSSIINNKNMSQSQKNDALSSLVELYNNLSQITDIGARDLLISKVDSSNLQSLSSIFDLINYINDLKLDIDITDIQKNLKDLGSNLSLNLNTEFSNLLSSYSEGIEAFSKSLSSAAKGYDFKSAVALMNELGLTIEDFNQKGGTFYLKDLNVLKDSYIKIDQEYQKMLEDSIRQKEQLYFSGIKIPVKTTQKQRFDLYQYVAEDSEKLRKQMYDFWEQEILASNPEWTFEQLEEARENFDSWRERGFIDLSDFNLEKEAEIVTGTTSLNLEKIIEENDRNIQLIEEELTQNWQESLENSGIDVQVLLSEIESYIDNNDFSISFSEFIATKERTQLEQIIKAQKEAEKHVMASTQISQGDIIGFLETVMDPTELIESYLEEIKKSGGGIERTGMRQAAEQQAQNQLQEIQDAIESGDWETVAQYEDISPFIDELYKNYNEIKKNVYSSVISNIGKSGYVTSTEINDTEFQKLAEGENALLQKVGDHLYKVVGDYAQARQKILNSDLDDATKAANLKTLHESEYTDKISAFKNILSGGEIDYSAAQAFAESIGRSATEAEAVMEEWGFVLNTATGKYKHQGENFQKLRDKVASMNLAPEDANELYAAIDDMENLSKDAAKSKGITDAISNYQKLSGDMVQNLATSLNMTYTDLKKYLVNNGNGTYSINVGQLQELLKTADISEATREEIEQLIAGIADDYLSNISNAANYITKGTTKQADITKFVNEFNTKAKTNLTSGNLFEWNPLLDSFTLKPEFLQRYIELQKQELAKAGFTETEISDYVAAQVKTITSQVNFSEFFSSEDKSGQSREKLKQSLIAAKAAMAQFTTADQFIEDGKRKYGNTSLAYKYAQEAAQAANDIIMESIQVSSEETIQQIEKGGDDAVAAIKEWAQTNNVELSSKDIEQAYRYQVNNITSAIEKLSTLQKGDVLDKTTLATLRGLVVASPDGVVESVTDLVTAYSKLYEDMKNTNIATTSELNSAYAKVLTASEQREIDAIDALQNAMGMTYDALGEMLAKYNISLEKAMMNPQAMGISQIGGGKIRIDNFKAFANTLGLKGGSEEYTSAFKAYNDSLIQLNKNAKEKIYNELNAITSAKAGDQINLTEIWTMLSNEVLKVTSRYTEKGLESFSSFTALDELNEKIAPLGGQIVDGILQLYDGANTNIVGILQTIRQYTPDISGEQAAQLDDTIRSLMTNITTLIGNGIKGALSSTDAFNLQTWASSFKGIGTLDFTQTADGLKLTQSSLAKVYKTLNTIDSYSARKLIPDIISQCDQYDTLSEALEILAHSTDEAAKAMANAAATHYLDDPNTYKDYWRPGASNDEQSYMNYYASYAAGQDWFTQAKGKSRADLLQGLDMARFAFEGIKELNLVDAINASSRYDAKSKEWYIDTQALKSQLKELGITWDEWINNFKEKSKEIQDEGVKRQTARSNLQYGQIEIQDIIKAKDFDWGKFLNLDNRANAQKQLSGKISEVMSNIKLSDGSSLWDQFLDKNSGLTDGFWQKFFTEIANGDWESGDMDELLQSALGSLSLTYDVESGQFKISINKDGIQVVDAKNAPLDGDKLSEWLKQIYKSGGADHQTMEFEIQGGFKYKLVWDGSQYTVEWEGPEPNDEDVKTKAEEQAKIQTQNAEAVEIEQTLHAKAILKVVATEDGGYDVWFEGQNLNDNPKHISQEIASKLTPEDLKLVSEAALQRTMEITVSPETQGDLEKIKSTLEEIMGEHEVGISAPGADAATTAVNGLVTAINSLQDKHIFITAHVSEAQGTAVKAKGNVALAGGTLVGELGPELVVSNGRYFVVGQNGAEMVNLPKDAIVFNHIQTQQLLANGRAGRGKPITNERNAAGMAHAAGDNTQKIAALEKQIASLKTTQASWLATRASALKLGSQSGADYAGRKAQSLQASIDRLTARVDELRKTTEESTKESKKKTKESKKTTTRASSGNKLHDAYGTVRHASTKTSGGSGSGSGSGGSGSSPNGSGLGRDPSSVITRTTTSSVGAKTGELTDKQKKAVSSAISEILTKGFESIDFDSDTFKDVPDNIKEEMKKFVADPNASYTKFLEKYKEYLDISVHEFNEKYFEALQKDMDNEGTSEAILSAAEGLTFFAGGSVAGSASDWVTLFGDYTDVQTLVKEEILRWDAALKKYVITDIEALKKYGTNLDIDAFEAIREDSIRESINQMGDWLTTGLKGTLSSVDFKSLQSYITSMGASAISTDGYTKTADGVKITTEAAAKLYAQLKEIDKVAASVTLSKLVETLQESDSHYATMSSTLARIKDLQDKIADASKYSDEKVKQYKDELALAEQIAAVRATTDDSSMNFLDLDLPGGFSNPLNYIQSWITGWKDLSEAASKGGAMNFKTLYNLAREMNTQAAALGKPLSFLGQSLDGTSESLSRFAEAMAAALGTDENGTFGVLFSKLGTDMTAGADAFSGSADEALKSMAEAQIKILDGLITYYEGIVALEKLGKLDVNGDKILGIDEIFKSVKDKTFTKDFQKYVGEILETFRSDPKLKELMKTMKVGQYTIEQYLEQAKKGVLKLKGVSAEQYQAIMDALYQFTLNDFQGDPATALQKAFAQFFGDMDVDLGDIVYSATYKVKITKKDGKWYTPKGTECKTKEEALRKAALEEAGVNTKDIDYDGGVATGKINYKGYKITVTADKDGVKYYYGKTPYKTLEEAQKAAYEAYKKDKGTAAKSYEEWKVEVGITVTTKMGTDTSGIDPHKVIALVGKTWDDVLAEYNKNPEEFKVKYGFEPDKTKTASDWAEWLKSIGIEDKVFKISMFIEKLDFSQDAWETIQSLIKGEVYSKMHSGNSGNSKKGGYSRNSIDSSQDSGMTGITPKTTDTNPKPPEDKGGGNGGTPVDTKKLEAYKALLKEVQSIVTELSKAKIAVEADKKDVKDLNKLLKSVDEYTTKLANVLITVNTNGASGLQEIVELLEALNTKLDNIKDKANVSIAVSASEGGSSAKGNVALAAGRTLMGELGPELVVSNGRYFTVGNNGAEFVNLPKDAIVFNHLQTQQLLSNGHASRGVPAVSETAAVSMAAGNALASASETLATLKALRAMWQALADSSIQDLVKTATAGSDSGGGGSQEQIGAWLKSVERWYNWLQKIAAIEKEINKEEAFRSKLESDRVKDGEAYFSSQARQLDFLQDKANTQADLAREYAERFEFRKRELNSENSPMSQFYHYNDYGQLYYVPGGFEKLQAIMRQDDQGHTITPKEQYDLMLKTYGLGEYMKYDSEGKEITVKDGDYDTYYREAVQAAWDRMEAEREEMQSLYDSSYETQQKYLESITEANKILQEIADNQMSVENSVLEAIESQRQEAIDKLTDEREALSDSVNSYIKGLRNSLENERKLYNNETSGDEIIQLQRQIAILRRSGGSATQIAGLEKDLNSKQREAYFTKQEEAIKAIEDSSNAELEKLQTQIDLMTETLNYEKDHGLLWNEVAEIMRGDAESIADFVTGNDKTWVAKSPLAKSEALQEALFEAQQWTEYRDSTNSIFTGMTQAMSNGFSSIVTPLAETKAVLDKVEESIRTTGQSIVDKLYTLSPKMEYSDTGGNGDTYTPTTPTITTKGEEKKTTTYKSRASLEVKYIQDGQEIWVSLLSGSKEAATKKEANALAREDIHNAIKNILHNTDGYQEGSLRYIKNGEEIQYSKWNDDVKDALEYHQFSRGGEVNYTGPAVVHGTPNNPEYMLNADEYRTWKRHIVGDNNSSLMSRLEEFNDLLGDLEKTRAEMDELRRQSYKNDLSGINIDHAEVSMHIDKIADDYDAQRAGEQALNKMLEIARKSAGNRIGR